MMALPAKRGSARWLAYSALLLSLSLLLSYVESLVPLPLALPGMKLGLANVAVMLAFFHLGKGTGAFISLLRVLLVSLLFGTASSFLFSLCGALLSLLALFLFSLSTRFGRAGISVGCAALHNVGQLVAGMLLYGPAVFSYLPFLLLAALVFGALCGVLLYTCETLLPL
jgi:heptaprenyl diphosphate synthase